VKKAFLILITTIMLSASGNCQWYNSRYGVTNINQLSTEQLNESLRRYNKAVICWSIVSLAGAIGIGTGIIFLKKTDSEAGAMVGAFLIAHTIPIEILGLAGCGIQGSRVRSIKKVLNSTELKMGLANYQMGNIYAGSQGIVVPGLSVTISF
jgi:hypothetical protein